MTTKTMDGEEYLANLESVDEQNYKRLFGEEYIKKSDVKEILQKSLYSQDANATIFQVERLPTINFSVIDEMIEERSKLIGISDTFGSPRLAGKASIHALQELKQRLYLKQ